MVIKIFGFTPFSKLFGILLLRTLARIYFLLKPQFAEKFGPVKIGSFILNRIPR